MKILMICRQFHPSIGGIETLVLNLCRNLRSQGVEADVLTLNRQWGSSEELPAHDEVDGIHVHRIPFWGSRRYAIATQASHGLDAYDLLHLHSSDFFLDYLAYTQGRHGKPMVLSSNGLFFHSKQWMWLKRIHFSLVTKQSLKKVASIGCLSGHDYRLLENSVPASKLHHIPLGFDAKYLDVDGADRDPDLIVSVGRLSQNKRYDLLLKAFASVLKRKPTSKLCIVGRGGDENEHLLHLCRSLGIGDAVTLMGEVPEEDLMSLLAKASLWCSSSEYESFGLALLESMAAGCLPVVSRLESFQEILGDHADRHTVDFEQSEIAADRMLELLDQPSEGRLKQQKRLRARASEMTWEHAARSYMGLYEQVLTSTT